MISDFVPQYTNIESELKLYGTSKLMDQSYSYVFLSMTAPVGTKVSFV